MPLVFEVLAEPNRRRILDLLLVAGERPVGALVAELGISQPAVSKHLRILRDAGLVEVRADGQHRRYRARPEGLREVDEWLDPYRRAWSHRLDALGDRLDELAAARTAPGTTEPAADQLADHPSHPTLIPTEDER